MRIPTWDDINVIRKAIRGDGEAMRIIALASLPNYQPQYQALDDELVRHRAEEWDDIEAVRDWAFDPETEVGPEGFAEAWSQVTKSVLKVNAGVLPALIGPTKYDTEAFTTGLRRSAIDLFLTVNNPAIRYTIVTGFEPELRHIADFNLDRIGQETWGTVGALVNDDIHDPNNYPPATREIMDEYSGVMGLDESDVAESGWLEGDDD